MLISTNETLYIDITQSLVFWSNMLKYFVDPVHPFFLLLRPLYCLISFELWRLITLLVYSCFCATNVVFSGYDKTAMLLKVALTTMALTLNLQQTICSSTMRRVNDFI